MTNRRTDSWDLGDFGRAFRRAADASTEEPFRRSFGELARSVASLDSEFCRETAECGARLAATMEELQSLDGRMGYCTRARGFEADCGVLYGDVDRTVAHVEALRESCFI